MKPWILILLVFCSCVSETSKELIVVEDTLKINFLKKLVDLKKEIDSVSTKDSLLNLELLKKSKKIDTLIEKSLAYKDFTLDYIILENDYTILKKEK